MHRRIWEKMLWVVTIGAVLCPACGGGTTGLGSANKITGTVFAPSGTSAVAGATVYIPSASSSISAAQSVKAVSDTADDGTTCDDPPEAACASTCSQADGTFSLATTGCSSESASLKIVKGIFAKTATLSCTESTCTLSSSDTTLPATEGSKLAVVTGQFDRMEDVLAKLGYGDVDSSGHLKVGTEKFAIYTGGGAIDSQLTDTATYKASTVLFGDVNEMKKYKIIFINCGTDESLGGSGKGLGGLNAAIAKSHHDMGIHVAKSLPSSVVSNVQTYVNDGGKLFVTDWAYDFIEQAFPTFMDFEDGGSASDTAETQDAAEDGKNGIVSDATVKDETMKTWLSKQTSNTIDSSSSPNEGACTTTASGNSTALLDASAGTIRIGDFLSSWIVMKGAHSGQSPKTWLEGSVTFTSTDSVTEKTETRPLTVSNSQGSGKLLYTSYHTAKSCPTTGAWPQERVLQYLVFEVAD